MSNRLQHYERGVNQPYFAGRSAYLSGLYKDQNPLTGESREYWDMGWEDEYAEHEQMETLLRGTRAFGFS